MWLVESQDFCEYVLEFITIDTKYWHSILVIISGVVPAACGACSFRLVPVVPLWVIIWQLSELVLELYSNFSWLPCNRLYTISWVRFYVSKEERLEFADETGWRLNHSQHRRRRCFGADRQQGHPLCNLSCKMYYIRMSRDERDRLGRELTTTGRWIRTSKCSGRTSSRTTPISSRSGASVINSSCDVPE